MGDDLRMDSSEIRNLLGDSLFPPQRVEQPSYAQQKKYDDYERVSYPTPPPPAYEEPEVSERRTRRRPHREAQTFRFFVLAAFVLCMLVVTVVVISYSLSALDHKADPTPSPPILLSESSVALMNVPNDMLTFVVDFDTYGPADGYNRYPPQGFLPDIDFSRLANYDICCVSATQRFVCQRGASIGPLSIDGYLVEDGSGIVLYLYVNSQHLVEVSCILSGTLLPDN